MKACFKKEHIMKSFFGFWIIAKNYLDQFSRWGFKRRKSTDLVHCELWFDKTPNKLSWGSSEEDGGTRIKDIRYSHSKRWVMLSVPLMFVNYKYSQIIDESDPRYGKQFGSELSLLKFLSGIHRDYDWDLIAHYVLPVLGSSKKKLVCSEALLFGIGYKLEGYNEVTPMTACDILSKDLSDFVPK